jgi:hypothetical protein
MAATRKSAKRAAGKKRKSAKRSSAKKRPTRKTAAKGRARRRVPKAAALKRTAKRTARKGLQAAREGIDTVRQAGEKTWGVLKSTTTQVVEGVRDRLAEDSDRFPSQR